MARIHITNPRDMCFIHICRSTELNMHLDFTGPLQNVINLNKLLSQNVLTTLQGGSNVL